MASPSRLLPPAAVSPSRHRNASILPAAAARSNRLPINPPRLRCRAAAAAAATTSGRGGGAVVLEGGQSGGGAAVAVREFVTLDELRAAVRLRIRTFYEYAVDSVGAEDLRKSLADREYEALQDRISGKMINFQRVSCINGTVSLLPSLASAEELCSACKFVEDGEERVVVGSLDLNQCLWLPDELTGKRPGHELHWNILWRVGENMTQKYWFVNESSHARAYLSNVCVAKELQRNGLGYALVDKSKKLAREWGITDLYVHVAINNEAAQKLYNKCGFVYESEEPAWKARFLGRPRRLLLWLDLKKDSL
uniref:N-acetyltransferase domain-containing protein n=1 Tax=Leersia perrieri TaxID=77586 RepID=A0A0D9X5Y4_9ORYZ